MGPIRLGGLAVSVHPLALAAAAVAVLGGYGRESALAALALALHEAAHLLVAHAYELPVVEVELLPFGARMRLSGLAGADPAVEALVALAGPLESLLLALAVGAAPPGLADPVLAEAFGRANLWLGLANLLPALPLDGGRLVRSLLAPRLGRRRATELVAWAGRATGVASFLLGLALLAQGALAPAAFACAWLVFDRSRGELFEAALADVRERVLLAARLRRLGPAPAAALAAHAEATVQSVLRRLAPSRFHVVFVVDDELGLVGVVDEGRLFRALAELGPDAPLSSALRL
ncbi:MAG: hypothetical protein IRZ11_01895 [Clostridia bacterium]|nr:hypothetical protein [Clostridia bacterium]